MSKVSVIRSCMTDAQQETSRKLVNLPWSKLLKFPWDEKLRGMSFVVDAPGTEGHMCLSYVSDGGPPVLSGIPDLCDPATVGVLASLAREVYQNQRLLCVYRGAWEIVEVDDSSRLKRPLGIDRSSTMGLNEGETWAKFLSKGAWAKLLSNSAIMSEMEVMPSPKPDVITPHQLRDRIKQRAAELGIALDFIACREYEVTVYVKKDNEKGTSVSVSLFDAMLWDHVGMDGIGKTLVAVQRALNEF